MLLRRSPLAARPQFRPPRPSTVVRTGLVAVLLCVAAAILYADPPAAPPTTAPAAAPGTGTPGTGTPVLPSGHVGVPIRPAEPAVLAALKPGDRVDVLALPGGTPVAGSALVLDVTGDLDLAVLLVALDESQAARVVAAGPEIRYGIVVRAR